MKETIIKIKSIHGKDISFTDTCEGGIETALICGFGSDSSGKSRFGLTGPNVTGLIATDANTRSVAKKHQQEFKRKLLMPTEDFVRTKSAGVRVGWNATMSEDEERRVKEIVMKDSREVVDRIKQATWALADRPEVKLIVIDNAGDLYDAILNAHYGKTEHLVRRIQSKTYKDTSAAKQEMRDFIDSINHKHLFMSHKNRDRYENNVNTGQQTFVGYPDMGFKVNLQVLFENNPKWKPDSSKAEESWHWALSIVKCRSNTDMEGANGKRVLLDDDITFQNLMVMVYPDSDRGDWE